MQVANKNPGPRELRQFGAAMLLGFGVLGVVLWYFGPEPNTWRWIGAAPQKAALVLVGLGLVLAAISVGPRAIARPVYVGWMTAAAAMGTVMTFVLLSVLFFVLLPVFSLIRLGDPLRLRLRPAGESYWEDHKHHESTLERCARPF
jgi:hypothetical protein